MSNKLQTLPSSLREKHRYLVFDVLSDADPAFGAVVDAVWTETLNLLGEHGVAMADPWIVKDVYDEERLRGAIKVHKDHVEAVRAALALITELDGTPATLYVVGVTGTLDSAREKYL